MGFFKKFQLGKVIGSFAKGFAQGGPKLAFAQAGLQAMQSTIGAATSRASQGVGGGSLPQFGGLQTSFGGAYGQAPGTLRVSNDQLPTMTSSGGPAMSGNIFRLLMMLAERLGVRIVKPNSVVPMGRKLLDKLIRFTRVTPGLTILSMLVTLGIATNEANQLIAWYSTAGKRRKRIRVTNVKALRRSVRRLEGFRKLAQRVEMTLVSRGGSAGRRRVTRCRSCRKSPCAC